MDRSMSEEWIMAKKTVIDNVFVPVGGGGLISGIAFYLKIMKKLPIKIIGVQPETNACMHHVNPFIKSNLKRVLKKEP